VSLEPRRNYQSESRGFRRSGLEDKRQILGEFSDGKMCRRLSSVCRGRRLCWIRVGGNWSRKKIPSVPHVHQSQPCTPATMKRVADSQLTKDAGDGDDGPEVNGW
jgi:hypothetical protein